MIRKRLFRLGDEPAQSGRFQDQTGRSFCLESCTLYSNYDDRIPGRFALYVDADVMKKDIKVIGYVCRAHSYPTDARAAFRNSVVGTFGDLVEELEVVKQPLTRSGLAGRGLTAMIVVEAEDYSADLSVIPGFFSALMQAYVEIAARITVDGVDGRLLGTSVEGNEDFRADAGIACEGGGVAVGRATEKAMRETMERLGERLANSRRIRALTGPGG